MKISTKKAILVIAALWIVIGFFIGMPQTALAVESDPDGVIEAGEVINDDVYLAGERVVVNGKINGDLFATGNVVVVNGEVEGSIFIAAQTLEVNGQVGGSVYGASYSMLVGEKASIGRNFYYAGFSFQANPGSAIGKDLMVAGYQAVLGGNVGRDVNASVGALDISGKIGRNVTAEVGDAEEGQPEMPPFFAPPGAAPMMSSGLRVSPEAEIGGSLTYSSQKEQMGAIKAKPAGGVTFNPIEVKKGEKAEPPYRESTAYKVGKYILQRVQELLTLFVLGGLAVWLIPQWLTQWSERARKEPLMAGLNGLLAVIVGYAGAGLVVLVLLAVVIFLSVVTLGGLSRSLFGIGFSAWGLAMAIFTLLVSYGSKIVIAFLGGGLLLERFAPQAGQKKVWVLLTGVLLYVIVRSIPILGWVVGVLATLVGAGAIYLTLRDRFKPSSVTVSEA